MTTSSNEDIRNNAHIDSPDKHKVILFYLNDSDGPTYFYDTMIWNDNPEKGNVIAKIEPKKGANNTLRVERIDLHKSRCIVITQQMFINENKDKSNRIILWVKIRSVLCSHYF